MSDTAREIKFRVWDGIAMRMTLLGIKYASDNGGFYIEGNYVTKTHSHLMQYTGLKDKNGVEIYEGDILRSIENGNVYLVEEFIPIQRTDNLTRLGVYIDGEYHKVPEDLMLGDDWKSWPEMYEVIGNIYENPELLERSK